MSLSQIYTAIPAVSYANALTIAQQAIVYNAIIQSAIA
ncbi:hypothetical protein GXM_02045 [Nostoc sphaeroides CCNUC1]|uniref:Uncharacterized protein n=1 Tax=Nostoc sphaeroides CCNUC1 TaxID=2653204 RepID=A0A5P8VW13_9NOSO|nr:hypothetical protein GXM_02045 [Nostoc sphaeroides CCNUC1]